MQFPHEIRFLDGNLNRRLMADFQGERTGFCQVGKQKWLLPAAYAKHAQGYYSMPLREDDVWIVTFPRSGTTLCQEIVWLINNNFNYESSAENPLNHRVPFYEYSILQHEDHLKEVLDLSNHNPEVVEQIEAWKRPGYEWAQEMPSPRHLKSHLSFSLLPPGIGDMCKVIYAARNPKDVAVSYYYHNIFLKLHGYVGNFKTYWNYFKNDLVVYSAYWEHIKEGWERRNRKNVLFLFYENLLENLPHEINKIANFLDKKITEEQIEKLVEHVQINNFRKNVHVHKKIPIKGRTNKAGQGFIRNGKVGNNVEFTQDLLEDANEWINRHLREIDITFPVL